MIEVVGIQYANYTVSDYCNSLLYGSPLACSTCARRVSRMGKGALLEPMLSDHKLPSPLGGGVGGEVFS